LTDERWSHIVDGHQELQDLRKIVLDVISQPERVLKGAKGELLAIREIESRKWLVVIYREGETDGFIITAFLSRRDRSLSTREQRWR
jgi:hypothetical protein